MNDENDIGAGSDIKDITFGEAFRRARQSGLDTFTFKGKKFTTALAPAKAKAAPAAPAEKPLLGPTPTKSTGVMSDMVNRTRASDRKVVDAAIRNRMAQEAADKEAEAKDKEKAAALEKSRRGVAGSVTDDPMSPAYFKGRVNPKTLLPIDESSAMKKGGKVKCYAKGGSVSSASSRADGIATKGRTKYKVY